MTIEMLLVVIGGYWIFFGTQTMQGKKTSKPTRAMLTEEKWKSWIAIKGKVSIAQGVFWIILAYSHIFSQQILMFVCAAGVLGCIIGDCVLNKKYVGKLFAA